VKATEAKLLNFLQKSGQFIIPIYQRTYSWTPKQCEQLWNDILRAGRSETIPGHFVGSIVYVEKGLYSVSSIPQLLVIDGQQRLTTVSLLIAALAQALDEGEAVDGVTARKLANYYLLNPEEDGELRYKLLLTQTDRETLTRIVAQKPQPGEHSIRIAENFTYFQNQIKGARHELPAVYKGIAKLLIVDIALNRDHDNPQLIFESLNSTGLDLSQADLIRNYVLMGLEPALQEELYQDHWRPMERSFGQADYTRLFDRFMRDYLTVKTGAIPNIAAVYEEFKIYAAQPQAGSVNQVVADIHRASGHFVAIALERENDRDLREAFGDINALKVDVAYPFLLELYADYTAGCLSHAELLAILRLVESYVFRRAVCGIPTNSLNKTFANLAKEIDKSRYLESVQAAFLLMTSYRRFPDDEEFARELQVKDLYNFRSRNYWLRRLENHGRKERVQVEEYTIEHIMPQNEDMPSAWRLELGERWQETHAQYLHTIGNLTLTGYNSELSDRPFAEKRTMTGGFADSPLRLNSGLGQIERWNEAAIKARSEKLAKKACLVWPAPQVAPAVVDLYRPKRTTTGYTLTDHPYLHGPMLELFEHFRRQVLNLDASVTEEILKLYIAYKATTNFVDVVPQSKRLRLSLNMDFADIKDPKGICKDVANLGRWGNGDVEVGLYSLDELPYVMTLVKQALDQQLFNGDE
jgi:uncharacterized protein with ParB-like and HNH nuclease domain/predicted transport protein